MVRRSAPCWGSRLFLAGPASTMRMATTTARSSMGTKHKRSSMMTSTLLVIMVRRRVTTTRATTVKRRHKRSSMMTSTFLVIMVRRRVRWRVATTRVTTVKRRHLVHWHHEQKYYSLSQKEKLWEVDALMPRIFLSLMATIRIVLWLPSKFEDWPRWGEKK
jgi:hypothetical protein